MLIMQVRSRSRRRVTIPGAFVTPETASHHHRDRDLGPRKIVVMWRDDDLCIQSTKHTVEDFVREDSQSIDERRASSKYQTVSKTPVVKPYYHTTPAL